MILAGDVTRDLLPETDTHAEEIIGTKTVLAGGFVRAAEVLLSYIPSAATQPAVKLPPASQADTEEITGTESTFPVNSTLVEMPHSGSPYLAMRPAADPTPYNEEDVPLDQGSDGQHVAVPARGLATSIDALSTRNAGGGRDDPEDPSDTKQTSPKSDQADSSARHSPTGLARKPTEIDDVHSINVRQIAIVDQEAGVKVSGYVGDVVTRLHIDQDLIIDQDETISVTIDGDGHFALLLDQSTHVDQEVEIDLEIFDIDGVLYVDVLLLDSIKIEQDTTLDMKVSDGQPDGMVEVNQDLELEQDLDIDIDIEDELLERYDINVAVEAEQRVEVEQDGAVAIKCYDGAYGIDVEAAQTATVEQLSIIQADFNLA